MNRPIYLFRLQGIPVFVEPWYFVLFVYMVATATSVGDGLLWAACVTFSILVHELGHGLAARVFALEPSILLHSWGGLTRHAPARRVRDDAVIIAAGPLAGLALGGLVYAAAWTADHFSPGVFDANPILGKAVEGLLYVNLFWSLLNLMPMFPLDGGLLLRLAANRLLRPVPAARFVHGIGLLLAAGWAFAGARIFDSPFLLVLGLMFAFRNLAALTAPARGAPAPVEAPPPESPYLDEARAAWAAGDARETARLCHMLRATSRPRAAALGEAYALIVLANVALGDNEEALRWAPHAPLTAPVVAARLDALLATGEIDAAKALFAEHGALLGDADRARLSARVSPDSVPA